MNIDTVMILDKGDFTPEEMKVLEKLFISKSDLPSGSILLKIEASFEEKR